MGTCHGSNLRALLSGLSFRRSAESWPCAGSMGLFLLCPARAPVSLSHPFTPLPFTSLHSTPLHPTSSPLLSPTPNYHPNHNHKPQADQTPLFFSHRLQTLPPPQRHNQARRRLQQRGLHGRTAYDALMHCRPASAHRKAVPCLSGSEVLCLSRKGKEREKERVCESEREVNHPRRCCSSSLIYLLRASSSC